MAEHKATLFTVLSEAAALVVMVLEVGLWNLRISRPKSALRHSLDQSNVVLMFVLDLFGLNGAQNGAPNQGSQTTQFLAKPQNQEDHGPGNLPWWFCMTSLEALTRLSLSRGLSFNWSPNDQMVNVVFFL